MILTLRPQTIDLVRDELDTNAFNCRTQDGYFCIQAAVYLEEEDELNQPYIELNGQENAQYGGIERVIFQPSKLSIQFSPAAPFLGKYANVEILPKDGVTRDVVDFFNNALFLGHCASYSADFDPSNVSPPIAKRDSF